MPGDPHIRGSEHSGGQGFRRMKRSKWNGFATIYENVEFLFGAGRLRERRNDCYRHSDIHLASRFVR
jgi:hypothetical protein